MLRLLTKTQQTQTYAYTRTFAGWKWIPHETLRDGAVDACATAFNVRIAYSRDSECVNAFHAVKTFALGRIGSPASHFLFDCWILLNGEQLAVLFRHIVAIAFPIGLQSYSALVTYYVVCMHVMFDPSRADCLSSLWRMELSLQ